MSETDSKYPKPSYAWYVAVLMMFFYVLSFMDRQIIAVFDGVTQIGQYMTVVLNLGARDGLGLRLLNQWKQAHRTP